MKEQRVIQKKIKRSHPLFSECDRMCFLSKNLYNSALYAIKEHQRINESKSFLSYYELNRKFIDERQVDYYALPAKVANQVLRMLDSNIKAYKSAVNKYFKDKSGFKSIPKPPRYLPKNGRLTTPFERGAINHTKKNDNFLKLSKTNISISFYKGIDNLQAARIVPKCNGDYYMIEIIYNVDISPLKIPNGNVAGIDLGVSNLATVTSNCHRPFIISGGPLKSINHFFNRELAKQKSTIETVNNKKTSKGIRRLYSKRSDKINDYLHKASKRIIDWLVSNNITTLVVGYNKDWKQGCSIGKVNNQKFVHIPYYKFLNMLKYKCISFGINTIIQEESYTSKCSFLDNEEICYHKKYIGIRDVSKNRGLFLRPNGHRINSDVNGSLNIIKKAISNAFNHLNADEIQGLTVNPLFMKIA